ncbi:MAG TPA: macro domain-containing protein [Candidatus Desulfofervidus auxilii]|uniref:Macro domain-containing protein n=1 Tax=Desulfofervidus auxilii TaxID=1621989 RepID=A0A7V0NET5_DESA2|nr:macro domain-containing protein [Candidatus Desulfofervidus auxilii]
MQKIINKTQLEIIQGDITKLEVDAIVNAAGSTLVMGGGVAGAILRAGGNEIQEECYKLAPIKAGEAVITTAGKLKAKRVIHAVGPRWGEGEEEKKLSDAILNSLKLADEHGLKSIAFPAISTGIFGCPKEWAAKVMLKATIDYLKGKTSLEKVIFCLFSESDYKLWCEILDEINV